MITPVVLGTPLTMSPPNTWKTQFQAEHAHAIGTFSLYYNALELAVYLFFRRYAPGPVEARASLYQTLHNKARRDFIAKVASGVEIPDVASDIDALRRSQRSRLA